MSFSWHMVWTFDVQTPFILQFRKTFLCNILEYFFWSIYQAVYFRKAHDSYVGTFIIIAFLSLYFYLSSLNVYISISSLPAIKAIVMSAYDEYLLNSYCILSIVLGVPLLYQLCGHRHIFNLSTSKSKSQSDWDPCWNLSTGL